MKKHLFTLVLLVALTFQYAWSQSKGAHRINYKFLAIDTYSPYAGKSGSDRVFKLDAKNAWEASTSGVGIEYYYGINDWLAVGIPFHLGKMNLINSTSTVGSVHQKDALFGNLDARLKAALKLTPKQFVVPYLSTGLGAMKWSGRDVDMQIPLELGLDFRLDKGFYITLASEYRFSFDEMKDSEAYSFTNNMHHALGLSFVFGEKEVEKETLPPPPAKQDRDGDGVEDSLDECPDEAGLAALNGCPDRDGDGVADKDDKCPDTPGLAKFDGCPDTDGDGIPDSEDECPELAGIAAFNGCPDTDGDGVPDHLDKCPNEVGPASNDGCPIKVQDRDNDGVPDAQDKCPDTPGLAKFDGCPDTDGDGIPDRLDKCPSQPGLAAFGGCPDTDGDGVPDHLDKCPKVAGTKANKGCPEIKQEDKKVLDFAKQAIEFQTGSAVIRSKSYPILDQIAGIMAKYPNYSMTISGYTDSVGNDANNLRLSERRAKACYDYLVRKGVSSSRMSSTGYGEASPIGDNATKAGRQKNRRVEFHIFLR